MSMKSGSAPLAAFGSPPIDVGGEEDVEGVLSEDELTVSSSKAGLTVSVRGSEARQDSLTGASESMGMPCV